MFRIEPFDRWPVWAKESFLQMGDCEETADNSRFFDGADEWVDNALVLAVKANFPTLLRLRYPVTGSYALGAIIGHQEWIIDNIDKFFPPEEVADLIIEEFDRWLEAYMKTLSETQRYQVIRHIRKSMIASARLFRAFDRACAAKTELFKQICIRSVSEAAPNERLEFLEGYTKALRRPAIRNPEDMSPREKALLFVLSGWRDVQNMRNRTVLRKTLGAVFNQPDVYSHDLVQDLCKDINLDLADIGRPKNREE